MRRLQFKSFFWKILLTIGVISVAFQFITLSTLAYFMVLPLGQRATDDLASVMTHGAETFVALPASARQPFTEKMKLKHELLMTAPDFPLTDRSNLLPYLYFLENSLHEQLGQPVKIKQSHGADGQAWFWADIPLQDTIIRFGFPRSRIGVKPPIAFLLLITIGLYLIVITAVMLTKRLTQPIEHLHAAAQAVGKGHWPEPVHIDGPQELAVLAREFNQMSNQVRQLLSNRTTLLAGIAHDLRTPLTQIQLALSMLPDEGGNPKLMKSIQEDLDVINHLIGETLSISLEFEGGKKQDTDIGEEIRKTVSGMQLKGPAIQVIEPQDTGRQQYLDPMALRRILTNLLANAVRYGDNKPVTVTHTHRAGDIVIEIADQGPGIPETHREAVFRPFYRLEKSRNSNTGGSGLGLAIAQQLANANKWRIQLLTNPGGGTIATLTIPSG